MARLWRARLAHIILRAMDMRIGHMLVIAAEVCAGPTRADAEKVVAEAKVKGFAGANVRRMQVVLVHP